MSRPACWGVVGGRATIPGRAARLGLPCLAVFAAPVFRCAAWAVALRPSIAPMPTHASVLRLCTHPSSHRCSFLGGKCLSDVSCCGGADDAVHCQRNSPTDEYGTCQVVRAHAHCSCSPSIACRRVPSCRRHTYLLVHASFLWNGSLGPPCTRQLIWPALPSASGLPPLEGCRSRCGVPPPSNCVRTYPAYPAVHL